MRIVIVDDHPLVRYGLQQTLELEPDMEVVGCAASRVEGEELIRSRDPDIAIVDLKMPDGSGLDLIRHCNNKINGCRYIILTAYGSSHDVSQALAEHVNGYILKEALPEEIIEAVRRVARGRRYIDPEVMEMTMNEREDNLLSRLTPREVEVLHAVSAGLNNCAIALKLHISEKTVKKHISNILSKLEFQDRIQAALYGFSQGLGREEN